MKTKSIRFGSAPFRAFLLALCIGLAFGALQIGEPLENAMKIARNKLRDHQASGSIILVAIDDRSVAEYGRTPWPSDQLAELVERVRGAGARRIHVDVELPAGGPSRETARLEAVFRAMGRDLLLPARFAIDPVTGRRSEHRPAERFSRDARLVNTNLLFNWDDNVWLHPYSAEMGGGRLPSLGSVLGQTESKTTSLFPIDYAIDARSIATISAGDVLDHRWPAGSVAGKDVVIARTDFTAEYYRAPGYRPVPAVTLHLLAAETLLAGRPLVVGWLLPVAVAALMAGLILYKKRRGLAAGLLATAATGFLALPILLEHHHVHAQVVPAIAVIATATLARLWKSLRRSYQARGTTNMVSGLPNMEALRYSRGVSGGTVVAARVQNYTQITTSLPPEHEKELVEQIVARLNFGTAGSVIHQADEGIFVWLMEQTLEESIVQQLEGLQALFRSPIVVATRLIDLSVTFGLDLDGSRALMQRVSSALVAADKAARDGKRWGSFNPASIEDAEWAMSLLTRLDHAIDNGELWVAYQPKVDCQTGRIVGAEALVRWTHPEKGEVYPDQFIGAAEQGGRIGRLTFFVLDTALAAAARANRSGRRFVVAVNLSAIMLGQDDLIPAVDALLKKHRLKPDLLMLEVTETSTLGSSADAIGTLTRLSEMGVQLSIDDYGTGFSTLEYLRRIPASEIKIDRSFIGMLHKSQSDRIMVHSTIQLAHSLGRKVVAEGVESEDILDELKRMQCDIVQGYHSGRPETLAALLERLEHEGREAA